MPANDNARVNMWAVASVAAVMATTLLLILAAVSLYISIWPYPFRQMAADLELTPRQLGNVVGVMAYLVIFLCPLSALVGVWATTIYFDVRPKAGAKGSSRKSPTRANYTSPSAPRSGVGRRMNATVVDVEAEIVPRRD